MNTFYSYAEYLPTSGAELFTFVMLPEKDGTFPTVVMRSPYVDQFEDMTHNEVVQFYADTQKAWPERGYAIVCQHCRGRGKSSGDCIPYVNEREDGLRLQEWIRKQSFYNGELYLCGGSYCTTVHYVTAPFADDIKGAVFAVQDHERYNICYRNGCFKKGLHGNWYVGMYKHKTHKERPFDDTSFDVLPLSEFTKNVFGEPVNYFDDMLKAPLPQDPFWQTHNGGTDARDAVKNARFPILFTTGFYDIYTGGIFSMWRAMNAESRARSILVVSPYNHGDTYEEGKTIAFEGGHLYDRLKVNYEIDWFDYIRGVNDDFCAERGKVTYFRLFENKWETDDYDTPTTTHTITLGNEQIAYRYDPHHAPSFFGGLSCNFGGTVFQSPTDERDDVITLYTEPFENDVFIKGNMSAVLRFCSDCEDTGVYMRISLVKPEGDYALRDDITSVCYQYPDYTPNSEVDIHLSFDEHAFLIKKGERLRIDMASANREYYVRHTNQKGLYSEQTDVKIAHNTVDLQHSSLILPIEI